MRGPAAVCRFFASNVLTTLYRDYFSNSLSVDTFTIENNYIKGLGKPILLSTFPQPGEIVFFNENQYVYNIGESYEIRTLTPFGKILYKTSQRIGNVDDGIAWISLTGLIVIIATIILLPEVKTATTLIQWSLAAAAALAVLTGLAYQRHMVLNQPN